MDIQKIPHYCQADKRWAKRILGKNRNFQQAGCAVTSFAMLISAKMRQSLDPSNIDEWLDHNQGYVGDNVVWEKLLEYAKTKGVDWSHWEHQYTNDLES